jgi:hypothetical protein
MLNMRKDSGSVTQMGLFNETSYEKAYNILLKFSHGKVFGNLFLLEPTGVIIVNKNFDISNFYKISEFLQDLFTENKSIFLSDIDKYYVSLKEDGSIKIISGDISLNYGVLPTYYKEDIKELCESYDFTVVFHDDINKIEFNF